ncbi:MAG: FAD-dependent oxidoreductase [Hyphomicrobiaceae bacterium]
MADELPRNADVVVIGGGIAGLMALYNLARLGVTDTVLVERRQLACGTTWHSVGSVGQVRGSRLLTVLSGATAALLPEIERETGMSTGYKRYGSIGLALTEERLEEFRRTVSSASAWGHEAAILSPGEIKERYPAVEVDDVKGGLFLPGDGRTNPIDTVQALARACRQRGARIFEETRVDDIVVEDGLVRGVRTSRGDILAEKVLLCAGMWSRDIAERIGVTIPLLAAEHFYAVTEPIEGLARDTPMVRVPDERTYYKEDAGKLLFGCLEEVAKPWGMAGIPESFCFDSLPPDLDHFAPILETAMERMPLLKEVGIKLFFNGPESFTPDGNFHIGETAEVRNLFVSCGFNTIGVMASGGIGRMAAELIVDGRASVDMTGTDVRRAARFETNVSYLTERITEGLGKLYGLQCPDQTYTSARGVRRSPLHADHIAAGAVMEHVAGFERPALFAPAGAAALHVPTYFRPASHDWVAAEQPAARERPPPSSTSRPSRS